jgi:protein SCO1/2
MQDLSRRNLFSLAAAAPLGRALASVKGASVKGASAQDPDPARSKARQRIQEQHLPNVPLISHEGREMLFYDDMVKDKIVTVNFFYSKCDEICPMVMANLVKVQKLLGEQVGRQIYMYSITLKPDQDTVDVVRKYRAALGAGPGWTFFSGTTENIDKIRKGIGFTYPEPAIDRDTSQHIGNVRYGNEPLMLWAACPGQAHTKWVAESFEWMVHPELNRVHKS